MAVGRQWIGLIVLLVAVASVIPPAAVVAQEQASTPASDVARVREFVEAVSSMLSKMKDLGIDVTKAEELLARAREALESGDLSRARSLALLALVTAGSRAREQVGTPRPVAAGVLMEIATLKRVAEALGALDLVSKLEDAEVFLSKGLVNETVKLVKEVREAIRESQVELGKLARERARVEVESVVRARVREGDVVSELVKELKKAASLSDLGRVLKTVRVYEKLRERFNAAVEDIDRDLTNVSEQSLVLLWNELGDSLEELRALLPQPVGLLVDIKTKIAFVERLKEKLPDDLKSLADDMVTALVKLNESVFKIVRCEEGYEEPLREAKELSQTVISKLSLYLPPRGPITPGKAQALGAVVQLYAIARWTLIMVEVLPKVVVCPVIGAEVVFKGVVLSTGDRVLAFGVVKTTEIVKVEPLGDGILGIIHPRRVAIKIGIFILDLSKLVEKVELSVGDIVSCIGVYMGRNQGKYPIIEVRRIEKLLHIELEG
ncbi:MAG: hypothetical protein QXD14_04625 [Sulfolobales archaeon]